MVSLEIFYLTSLLSKWSRCDGTPPLRENLRNFRPLIIPHNEVLSISEDNQTLDNCRNFGLRLQRPAPPAGAGRAGEESQGPKRSPELAETKVRAGAERVASTEELRKL